MSAYRENFEKIFAKMFQIHSSLTDTALIIIFVRHKQDSESTKMKVISLNKYDMQLINDVTIGRVSYLIYVSRRHYVLTTSGDIVVCFRTAVCLS